MKKEFDIEGSEEMIDSTFLDLSFDGKNVTKQALYDHITTVAVVSYDPSEIK